MSSWGIKWTDLLRLFGVKLKADIKVAFPAKVERVAGGRIDVQPEVDQNLEAIDGSRIVDALPVIPSVKVLWPRSLGYAITWPLTTDDTVLVVCTDRNLGAWMRTRSSNPGDVRAHTLDGAVAIPGLYADADDLDSIPDHLVMRSLAGDGCSIHVRDGDVRLGADAGTQFVALENLVGNALTALKTAISGTVVVANDGGASFKSTLLSALSSWPPSVAATKTRAK